MGSWEIVGFGLGESRKLKMKDFAGTPGTLTGFALRVSQFLFASASIASMTTTSSFFNFTAFWYVILIKNPEEMFFF